MGPVVRTHYANYGNESSSLLTSGSNVNRRPNIRGRRRRFGITEEMISDNDREEIKKMATLHLMNMEKQVNPNNTNGDSHRRRRNAICYEHNSVMANDIKTLVTKAISTATATVSKMENNKNNNNNNTDMIVPEIDDENEEEEEMEIIPFRRCISAPSPLSSSSSSPLSSPTKMQMHYPKVPASPKNSQLIKNCERRNSITSTCTSGTGSTIGANFYKQRPPYLSLSFTDLSGSGSLCSPISSPIVVGSP